MRCTDFLGRPAGLPLSPFLKGMGVFNLKITRLDDYKILVLSIGLETKNMDVALYLFFEF